MECVLYYSSAILTNFLLSRGVFGNIEFSKFTYTTMFHSIAPQRFNFYVYLLISFVEKLKITNGSNKSLQNSSSHILPSHSRALQLGVLSAGFYLLLTTWWPGQGFIWRSAEYKEGFVYTLPVTLHHVPPRFPAIL